MLKRIALILVSLGWISGKGQVYSFPTEARWVDSVFNTLSREERIGQLIMAAAFSIGPERNEKEILGLIKDQKIGGILFLKGTAEAQATLTNLYQKKSKIPLLISIDGEWGVGMRLENVMRFPRQMSLGAIKNDSLIYRMGREVAEQCKAMGIHVNFAPDVDINNNPANPVINDRSFGDDKYNVTDKAYWYMKGMQDNGIIACLKHFPGHGDTKTDSHLGLPVLDFPRERLDTLELYPFRELINKGAMSLMVAHMRVLAFDTTKDLAISLSPKTVTGYIQDTLGFKGLIFTDGLNMKGVSAFYSQPEIALKSLQAGNDILLYPTQIPQVVARIKQALDSNELDSARFNRSVKKVLAAKYQVGLTKTPHIEVKNIRKRTNTSSAMLLREELIERQITVVKNHKHTLPLRNTERKKMASVGIGENFTTLFQQTLNDFARFDYYKYDRSVDSQTFINVLKDLHDKDYDVIVVSIHNTNRDPDRNFGISKASIDFINKLNEEEKIVLVSFGIPYNLNFFPGIKTLMVAYQDAEINQEKAAQMLFGCFNNRATLPVNVTEEYQKGAGIVTDTLHRLSYGLPEDLGYSSYDFEKIDFIVNSAVREKSTPGAQVLVAKDGKVIYQKAYGNTTYDGKTKVDNTMLYDLASMTKILATTLSVMRLYEEGFIDIDKPVSKYLKELRKTNKKDITVKQVMTHTAGLKAWIPFYKATLKDSGYAYYCKDTDDLYCVKVADSLYMRLDYKDSVWQYILNSELDKNNNYVYSDLGFYIMQRVVERLTGKTLDQYAEENFYRPLELATMTYKPLEKFSRDRIVPTELDKEFRKQLVWGYVHDPGAAMMGGVSGHAGLFGNANDVAIIMQMLLQNGEYNGKRYFKPKTVELFTGKQLESCRRGLGFDKPEADKTKGNPAPDVVPCSAFGHSGFTGTIVWADPENHLIYVFLSNRVYPTADNNSLTKNNVRSRVQEVIYDIVLKK